MNQWSIRRKRIILLIIFGVLFILIGGPLFFFFHNTPSCTDSKQNGDEAGVDCGGSCKMLCQARTLPLLMKGDPQVLKVATSTFELIARVENPNLTGEISRAAYVFKVYEKDNPLPLKIVSGNTLIPKNSNFVIFQGPFNFGQSIPMRTTFEWDAQSLIWSKNLSEVPQIRIRDAILSRENSTPRLEANVLNESQVKVSNLEFVALISDENHNALAASKTFIDSIKPGESMPIVFTWPSSFSSATTSFEIIPRILPDKSYIQ